MGMYYVTKQGTNNQKLANQHARYRSLIVKFMFTVAKDKESAANLGPVYMEGGFPG